MSTPVMPTEARPTPAREVGLRRLRGLCIAIALGCLGALPFELGLLPPPNPVAVPLAGVFFPRPTATAPAPTPTVALPTATAPGTMVIHNYPRTAVVGHTERFSVVLPGQPDTELIYILQYPDAHWEHARVRTDSQGRSSHTFRISSYQPRSFRETAAIGVEDTTGQILAFTRFAIQQR